MNSYLVTKNILNSIVANNIKLGNYHIYLNILYSNGLYTKIVHTVYNISENIYFKPADNNCHWIALFARSVIMFFTYIFILILW